MQSSQPFSEDFLTFCIWDYSISVPTYKTPLTAKIAKSRKFLTTFQLGQNKVVELMFIYSPREIEYWKHSLTMQSMWEG